MADDSGPQVTILDQIFEKTLVKLQTEGEFPPSLIQRLKDSMGSGDLAQPDNIIEALASSAEPGTEGQDAHR